MLKGKNTIRLIGLFAVLVLIYVIIRVTGGDSRSESYRETLVDIDTAKVTRVEIIGPEEKTVLTETESGWTVSVSDSLTRPAEANTVKSLLNTLKTIEPSRLAARSEDKWKDFQVDSAGTRVIVYEGNDEALDIILGRFGVEGQRSFYTYVRLNDEEDTYVANDFMKMSVNTSPDDFRNNDVLRLEADSLSSIEFDYPDSAFTLVRSGDQWLINDAPADSANTAKYLSGLRFVTSKKFADGEGKAPLYKVIYHFTDQADIEVTMLEDSIIRSSFNKHEFFADATAEGKVFKGAKYFQ